MIGHNFTFTVGGNVVGKARDVDVTLEATEVDITTRDDGGWKNVEAGLASFSADAEELWVPTDAALQSIRAAFLAKTPLACIWLDEDGNGWSGSALVLSIGMAQPLDDAAVMPATFRGKGAASIVGVGS